MVGPSERGGYLLPRTTTVFCGARWLPEAAAWWLYRRSPGWLRGIFGHEEEQDTVKVLFGGMPTVMRSSRSAGAVDGRGPIGPRGAGTGGAA